MSVQAKKEADLLEKRTKHIIKELDKEDNIKRRENLIE